MTFQISPAELEAKRQQLGKSGITIEGDSGTIQTHGVALSYTYDGATLTVTTVSKPFYIPQSTIDSELSGFFA